MKKDRKRPFPHFKFPDEITISFEEIPKESLSWYGAKEPSYNVHCTNYGWFPTEILMGVTKGKFDQHHEKSLIHGASIGNNLGSAGIMVKKDKIQDAIDTLRKVGYQIQE